MLQGVGRYGRRQPLGIRPAAVDDPAIERYTEALRPDVGYRLVQDYLRLGRIFPVVLTGDDQWIFRTYLKLKGRQEDDVVSRTLALGLDRRFRREAELLSALLMTEGATPGTVAHCLGVDRDVVACYEKLFWNVLDRQSDMAFIRNVVYPDGRMVEMFDEYLRNESLGNILLRAGFNNGVDDVLFLAGANRIDLIKSIAAGDNVAKKLEALFMANGYVAARNGWLNQADARGLMDAKALLAAAKQGGFEQEETNPMHGAGAALYQELRNMAAVTREAHARKKISVLTGEPLAEDSVPVVP
jgi:hypothetical protein